MNKVLITLLLSIGWPVVPQQAPVKTNSSSFAALQFLLGDWEALSQPSEATGNFSFTREVQGRGIAATIPISSCRCAMR